MSGKDFDRMFDANVNHIYLENKGVHSVYKKKGVFANGSNVVFD